jgi:hypothetical protein
MMVRVVAIELTDEAQQYLLWHWAALVSPCDLIMGAVQRRENVCQAACDSDCERM